MKATIVQKNEREHVLMLGDHELGTSKTDCDARIHMHAINEALQTAYWRDHEDGIHDNE